MNPTEKSVELVILNEQGKLRGIIRLGRFQAPPLSANPSPFSTEVLAQEFCEMWNARAKARMGLGVPSNGSPE